MKKRIGNDITFTWHIYRKSGESQTPESFDGKDVEVKLISPLKQPVTIEDVSIATGVVTFTFKGKHQVTLGNYVAVLLENRGEDGMVTLDVVNAVSLVPHSYMEEDGDEGDVIEASSVELESSIIAGGIVQQQADWAQTDDTAVDFIKNKPDLALYCRKDATNVHTGGYDQYIKDFGVSVGNVAIDAQALWVRLLYPNGELVSETRVGPGNIRITKNGITLNLNPAYFQALVEAITGIEAVIPAQASSSNQLADKDFVNSSIATATAAFRGAFNLVTDLHLSVSATHAQIATALATTVQTADNNDYCFVQIPTADATPTEFAAVERYKFNGTEWAYEYTLNNSGFTASQWAAINSYITSGLVAKLSDLPTATELATLLAGKASTSDLAEVATTGSYNDLRDKPDLSAFITKSVNDLTNYYLKSETYTKNEVLQLIGAIQQFHYEVYPTLPQTGASNVLYLIGPTGTGADKYEEYVYANNDWTKIGDTSIDLSGYVTTQALTTALADYVTSSALSIALAGKADKSEMSVVSGTGTDVDKTTITLKQGTSATVLTAHQDITGKENMMPITTATGATLSAVVGNYYRLDNVGTLAITLPTITGATKLQAITFLLICGSNAVVTFAPQGSETILYQEDFALEADTTYEVTALWNGSEWTLSRVIYE